MANIFNVIMSIIEVWKEIFIALGVLGGSTLFIGFVGDFIIDYLIEREKLKEEKKHCKPVNNKWRRI